MSATLVLHYGPIVHSLSVDLSAGAQTLRLQICSITNVEPNQQILYLSCAPCGDEAVQAGGASASESSSSSAAEGSPSPSMKEGEDSCTAVLPPAISNNDGRSLPVLSADYIATDETLIDFLSRRGHATTGILLGPYGLVSAETNFPDADNVSAKAQKLLRSLGPVGIAKQSQLLSSCTQTTLQGVHPAQRPSLQRNMNQFISRCKSNAQHVLQYEDLDLRLYALSILPMVQLTGQARTRLSSQSDSRLSFGDCFYRELGAWFKKSFFKWTNFAPCSSCGGKTTLVGRAHPNDEERSWQAGTVEVYTCNKCRTQTRFPRYNHPRKLLETRQGRCGEWANAFTLLCRAVGYDARLVHDWTDHVWTETYSPHLKRWIHFDSCENACDSPLMYESGWGKKLNYIVSASRDDVTDVTSRYTQNISKLQRHLFPEPWLQEAIKFMDLEQRISQAIREESSFSRWNFLTQRRLCEQEELLARQMSQDKEESSAAKGQNSSNASTKSEEGHSPSKPAEKRGRISGSAAWRAQRGELGAGEAKTLALLAEEQDQSERAATSAGGDTPASTTSQSSPSIEVRMRLRVKELFDSYRSTGMDPNIAAAKALSDAKTELKLS